MLGQDVAQLGRQIVRQIVQRLDWNGINVGPFGIRLDDCCWGRVFVAIFGEGRSQDDAGAADKLWKDALWRRRCKGM